MKSIMLSVQPMWVDNICHEIGISNGLPMYEKEDEVRKNRPLLSVPFKVYIYESRRRKMVIGHFICDRLTYIRARVDDHGDRHLENTAFLRTCLSDEEIFNYLVSGNGHGWAWHISALKIYDKPRKLKEFKRPCPVNDCHECRFASWQMGTLYSESKIVGCAQKIIAPQNWCYVMEVEV